MGGQTAEYSRLLPNNRISVDNNLRTSERWLNPYKCTIDAIQRNFADYRYTNTSKLNPNFTTPIISQPTIIHND